MLFLDRNKRFLYTINRDWLSFSVRALDDIHSLEFRVPEYLRREEGTSTQRYNNRDIYTDKTGSKVFTLLYNPKSGILDEQLVFVEIGNSYLYDGLDLAIDALKCLFRWEFRCVSRFDICLDFELWEKYKYVVDRLFRRTYRLKRYANGAVFIRNNDVNQISWGMAQSCCKWKLYNKTLELKVGSDRCEKMYIVQNWIEGGANVYNMWRLELSMTSLSTVVFNKQKLSMQDVLSDEMIVDIFSSMYDTRFKIMSVYDDKVDVEFLRMPKHEVVKYAVRSGNDERKVMAGFAEVNHLLRELDESRFIGNSTKLTKDYVYLVRRLLTPEIIRYYDNIHDVKLYDRLEQYLYEAESRKAVW